MKIKLATILLLFLFGIALGVVIDRTVFANKVQDVDSDAHSVRLGGYSLINPLLECEVGSEKLTQRYTSFKYKIQDEVDKLKKSGDVEEMAVYFRDLNNGFSIGINQDMGFTPASLLKLPVMMAYFKQSESDPSILKKSYKYTDYEDRNVGEHVKPRQSMERGQSYTVEDLIYRMIVFSDNNAMALLVENLPLPIQDKVYTDLDISIPGVRGVDDYMSVSDYAAFFRILYNASYLSKDNSQKALGILTKVDFAQGIRAGVPSNIPVANKFGEREEGNNQQVHDFGIIYYNDHPYLLGVMSRGKDFDKQAASIKDISRMIYSQIQKQVKL